MRDLAVVNGRVWPSAAGGQTAVRMRDGVISLVGSDDHVLADRTGDTQIVDVGGRPILPAFADSHTHFHRTAVLRRHFIDLGEVTITGVTSVLAAVAARAADSPAGTWIQGDNLSDGRLLERRFPTRAELDKAAPEHPVLLRGIGKHVVVANSRALRLAGIDRETADPPGGRIEHDASGEPTGVLHERGKLRLDTTRTDTVVPPLTATDRLDALAVAIRELQRKGVTTIHEITRTSDEFADYARLRERGGLGVRVVSYVRVVESQASLADLTTVGMRSGYGDDWLRLGGVKVSIDGSCTFRNAAMYDAYPGEPENRGIVRMEQREVDDVIREAASHGLAIAVHAIGPRAVDMALDGFERLRSTNADTGLRHRIEHAYVMPGRSRLERMQKLGLVLSMQPAFISTVGDVWVDIFGDRQAREMVPLRTAIDVGLTVLANSDCPTAPVDPMLAIAAAVGRRTKDGRTLGVGESVTVEEAVHMQTAAPAFAAGSDSRSGRIGAGMLGDLVVLDRDPRTVAVEEIPAIGVHATVLDGEVVFESSLL